MRRSAGFASTTDSSSSLCASMSPTIVASQLTAHSARMSQPNLPRVLCLHGAGSSGAIYQAQGRKIFRALRNDFRFVFLDAPFESPPGPGMMPTYGDSGPFYRWQCDESAIASFDVTMDEVLKERERVKDLLDAEVLRADGAPIVGVMAFSQGARVATGLLDYLQQERKSSRGGLPDIRFAVINSGTYPPLSLGQTEATGSGSVGTVGQHKKCAGDAGSITIQLPSLHLHGANDPWRPESESLLVDCYEKELARKIVFEGGHQVPTGDSDASCIVAAIREMSGK